MKNNPRKIAVRYLDREGRERVKNCGNAQGVRDCLFWLKRDCLEFLGKEIIVTASQAVQKPTRQRIHR